MWSTVQFGVEGGGGGGGEGVIVKVGVAVRMVCVILVKVGWVIKHTHTLIHKHKNTYYTYNK